MARLTDLQKLFEAREAEQEGLLALLRNQSPAVEDYIRKNVRIPQSPLGVPAIVNKVRDVAVIEIRSVYISPFKKDPVQPYADVALKVYATGAPTFAPGPSDLLVGQEADRFTLAAWVAPTIVEFEAHATLTFRVHPSKGTDPPTLEFTDVRFETNLQRHIKGEAMKKALLESLRGK